jgi:hypothetical protein
MVTRQTIQSETLGNARISETATTSRQTTWPGFKRRAGRRSESSCMREKAEEAVEELRSALALRT